MDDKIKKEYSKMKDKKIQFLKFAMFLGFFAFLIFGAKAAEAATLYFSPSSGNFSVGNILNTSVLVNTQGKAINNSSAVINFPASLLEVISVSKSGSIFSLWVEEPAFSNSAGTISFDGGLPTPGFNGTAGKIVNIVFRIRNAGTASLVFSSGAVLANDGYGTDILQTMAQAQFNLISEERPVAPPPTALGTPQAPEISSPTHPDSNKWYAKNIATFTWPISPDVTATRLLVGRLSVTEPIVLYTPPISQKTIENMGDGVWYFNAQLRNNSGWGDIAHFKFQVDTKQPDRFDIQLAPRKDPTERRVKFVFDAHDEMSGIDHYEVRIDDRADEIWVDDGSGVYGTSPVSHGNHILIAKAVDRAGNFVTNSIEFAVEQSPLFKFGFFAIDVLSIIIPLLGLLVLLFLLLWYVWRRYQLFKKRVHKEVQEVDESVHKSFDSLRKDVREHIARLENVKSRRQLSEEEDQLMHQLKKNLDNAEKIIDKEVKDVEKEIK